MNPESNEARGIRIATWSELEEGKPAYALAGNVDLVVLRRGERLSVLYGRCLHRGALMSDGHLEGDNLICGVHDWDYRWDTGVSEYNNAEALKRFTAWVDEKEDAVYVDGEEIRAWEKEHPQPYRRDEYLGLYADTHGTGLEPHNASIQELARDGLSKLGRHGRVAAMGVPRSELPSWDDIQILTAQLSRSPLLDEEEVESELVIGPRSRKPLRLALPVFVSDMSFGALSQEAREALARGAELAGVPWAGAVPLPPDEMA